MSDVKKIFCLFILISLVAGCGPDIPTSESPAAIEKVFSSPFDNVWNNSLKVIETAGGTIIAQNKSAGLITCKLQSGTSKLTTYANIYIKRHPRNQNDTIVYIIPFNCTTYNAIKFPEPNVQLEFQDISFRNTFFSDIGDVFFNGLKNRLQESKL